MLAERVRPVSIAADRLLPVVPWLAGVLPGGLPRGTTVAVSGVAPTSVALALAAGPSAAGSWVAALAMPDLGAAAAAEAGVALRRFALVPDPGDEWSSVTAALLDGVDLVMARPPPRLRPRDARRLVTRARERGAVLVAVGEWPEGANLRIEVTAVRWDGIERGHGHLTAREMEVVASGRGAASRERRSLVRLGERAA